jgi:hypothetical protein
MYKPVIYSNKGKTFVLFFGPTRTNGVCSNWYKSKFTVDNLEFSCVEQYMMYKKAELFGDRIMMGNILHDDEPRNMKRYGRLVQHFNPAIWNAHKFDIVYDGVKAKFEQNEELKAWLKSAKCDYFVECSPYDGIWGIKMGVDDPNCMVPEKWNGQNLLGKVLDKVRAELIAD